MRYFQRILTFVFIVIFLILAGRTPYNKDGVYYYPNLQAAMLDIDYKCIGRRDQGNRDNPDIVVTLQDGVPTICLLKNLIMNKTVLLNNANLDLNGFMLTNNETTLIKTYGTCRIYNGFLCRYSVSGNESDGLFISRNSTCRIENIEFKVESSNKTNIAIHTYGNVFLANSNIELSSLDSDQQTITAAIYGNLFSNIHVDSSDIIAKADFGRVEGVYVGDIGCLINSNITAYANYQSNDTKFTSCAIGCNNYGTLNVNDCIIYGVHSGVNSSGALSIDGGTYYGYGHGGIYCAGSNREYRIVDATILQAEMPIGYQDMGVGCMQGGIYIGGGKNRDNIQVFIDNCIIEAIKNPIVLRGTSGEKNNSLYISNTILNVQHIRVDNDTHRVFLGEGCNFEQEHIDIPEIVICTNVSYAKP